MRVYKNLNHAIRNAWQITGFILLYPHFFYIWKRNLPFKCTLFIKLYSKVILYEPNYTGLDFLLIAISINILNKFIKHDKWRFISSSKDASMDLISFIFFWVFSFRDLSVVVVKLEKINGTNIKYFTKKRLLSFYDCWPQPTLSLLYCLNWYYVYYLPNSM